jgi:hypothetical protein
LSTRRLAPAGLHPGRGALPCALDLPTLFGGFPGEDFTDPRVIYDSVNGKFVVIGVTSWALRFGDMERRPDLMLTQSNTNRHCR